MGEARLIFDPMKTGKVRGGQDQRVRHSKLRMFKPLGTDQKRLRTDKKPLGTDQNWSKQEAQQVVSPWAAKYLLAPDAEVEVLVRILAFWHCVQNNVVYQQVVSALSIHRKGVGHIAVAYWGRVAGYLCLRLKGENVAPHKDVLVLRLLEEQGVSIEHLSQRFEASIHTADAPGNSPEFPVAHFFGRKLTQLEFSTPIQNPSTRIFRKRPKLGLLSGQTGKLRQSSRFGWPKQSW